MDVLMGVVFLIFLMIFGSLFLISKGKYDEYIENLDKKAYPLKQLFPIALFVLNSFKYTFSSKYDRNIQTKLAEISGHKYSAYYLQIHWANKLSYDFLALLFLLFVGVSMGPDPGFIVFGIIMLGLLFYMVDSQLDEKIKKRRLAIQLDFPEFINKLTLLINAGMTVARAWEKVVLDNKKQTPLFEELSIALSEIKSGKSEQQAYEDFARRCRTKEITKFISVIVINLKKGGAEVVSVLRLQSSECWEMRKAAAKRLGEEASTKMMLPLMMMFFAILLIVAVPAILQMQGI